MKMDQIPKCPYVPFAMMELNGSLVWNAPGRFWQILSNIYSPSASQCCEMVVKIRITLRWSRTRLAAFMGVNHTTIRKWETMERNPNGSARRLIWLVYILAVEPEKLGQGMDFVLWGKTKELEEFGKRMENIPGSEPASQQTSKQEDPRGQISQD